MGEEEGLRRELSPIGRTVYCVVVVAVVAISEIIIKTLLHGKEGGFFCLVINRVRKSILPKK